MFGKQCCLVEGSVQEDELDHLHHREHRAFPKGFLGDLRVLRGENVGKSHKIRLSVVEISIGNLVLMFFPKLLKGSEETGRICVLCKGALWHDIGRPPGVNENEIFILPECFDV